MRHPRFGNVNEEAASIMKHGKLVHIDGAGHNLHHDQWKRTIEVVTAFDVHRSPEHPPSMQQWHHGYA